MDEVEAAIRAQMRRVSRELEALRFRLQGASWNLLGAPSSTEEAALQEGSGGFTAYARTVIDCIVADCLIPARRSLLDAARYVVEEKTDPSLPPHEPLPPPSPSDPEERP